LGWLEMNSEGENTMREASKKEGWKYALLPRYLVLVMGVLLLALADVSCGSGAGASSGSASAVVVNSSGGMLISASAINFARNAVVGEVHQETL